MNSIWIASLASYWSAPAIAANISVFLNLLGALALGVIVGYERSYHGRAAGMRTYGLVCMASAALTVIAGYPAFWYGGHVAVTTSPDPTRVIQGIVTGIGFLGAGVIMHEGYATRGLSTAASIWTSAAMGVLVGIGFYISAIMLALLSVLCMSSMALIERRLPSRQSIAVSLQFRKGFVPREDVLRKAALERGYEITSGSISIKCQDGKPEWHFVASALGKHHEAALTTLATELSAFDGVESFQLNHARN